MTDSSAHGFSIGLRKKSGVNWHTVPAFFVFQNAMPLQYFDFDFAHKPVFLFFALEFIICFV
jgi:hypothetical protein